MPSVQVNDLNMHYIDQGAGEPVLLIHGNVSSSTWWNYTFEHMSDAPYRLIAPDLRGRGDTSGPSGDWTINTLADDVRELVVALGLGAVHLVGHSLGACVAIQYALDHRAEVRSLTLIAPGWVAGDIPDAVTDPARIKAMVDNKAVLKMALRMTAAKHPDAGWNVFEEASLKQTDDASLRSPVALKQWNVAARLGELAGVPTFITRGDGDIIVPEAVVMASVHGIPGANYEIIPGATHSPNVEMPDAWVALLKRHLATAH